MAGLATYTRTLEPGETQGIGARGNFIRIHETGGDIEVTARSENVGAKGGEAYKLNMKKFEKLYAATEFDKVEIRNLSDVNAITVVMQIGYGDYAAEIISRTAAGKIISVSSFDSSILLPGGGFQQLLPENLQRKRAIVQVTRFTPAIALTIDLVTPKITVDWTAARFVSGLVGGYEVWRCDLVGTATWADLLAGTKLTTTAGNILTYDDLTATPGTNSYAYGVRALEINTGLLPAGGRKRSNVATWAPA